MKARWLTLPIVGVTLALTVAACGGPPSSAGGPAPSHAGTFDDGGTAAVGGVDLEMSGLWEQADGAVSLDGGSGSGASAAPGPVVTTEGFTVAAWVSLPPPRLIGQQVYAAAVSQIGSVAAAFYLGTAEEGRWSFGMKDADTNEPGHTFRATGVPAEADADRWVHLAGTYDADAGEIRLNVDGDPAARAVFAAPWQAEGPLTVGRAQADGSPSDFWPGAVADVRTFGAALDDAQIRDLMEQTRPTASPLSWPAVPDEVSALNGTYVYRMTTEESQRLEGLFGVEAQAAGFPGDASVVMRFAGGLWQQYFAVDGVDYLIDGQAEGDGGTYAVDGDRMIVNNSPVGTYRWSLEDDVLSLTLLDNPPDADVVRFITQHRFDRVED